MDGRSEADTIVFSVVDRVEKLHESVAEDMHVVKAGLVNIKLANHTLTSTFRRIDALERTLHPVVCRDNIVHSIDNVCQLGGSQEVVKRAIHFVAVRLIKNLIVFLRESQLGSSRIRSDGTVGALSLAVAC